MKFYEYRERCEKLGTLKSVARRLGVNESTIYRRQTGESKVTREAVLALEMIEMEERGVLKVAPVERCA